MGTPEDRATELLIQMPEVAREHFICQWNECQAAWEYEDWFDRVEATLAFYQAHWWDEAGLAWRAVPEAS